MKTPLFDRLSGFSLVELAFALLVIGVVLGAMWEKAGGVYGDYEINEALQELNLVVQAVRMTHPNDLVVENENLTVMGLSPDLTGSFAGQKIIYNPWRGRVSVFPGNASGWGLDTSDDDYTIRYDGLPSSACTGMLMQLSGDQARNGNLVAVYISPQKYQGKMICFKTDKLCLNTVNSLNEDMIDHLCREHSGMTVMFTYQAG